MKNRHHGAEPRGLSDVPRIPSYEGRFGRMFQGRDPFEPDEGLLAELAEQMHEGEATGDNPDIPSGYTYLGQFVDHDLTFDASSAQQRLDDPHGRLNFRTPRFDLDSVYGSGPTDEPFQYDRNSPDSAKLLIGTNGINLDLPRNEPKSEQGRAIIGDPRNDENVIVSQLHLAFLRFHNELVDKAQRDGAPEDELFERAQREARWHFQWVVVHDYLRRLIGGQLHDRLLTQTEDDLSRLREVVHLRFYRHKRNPYMPLEFSGAAFRFGHTQARNRYVVNEMIGDRPLFAPGSRRGSGEDLRGFQPLLPNWHVSWPRFFAIDDEDPQPSRRMDTHLSNALFALPDETGPESSLAFRNLRTGVRLGLPSGQDVADEMDLTPLSDRDLEPCRPGGAPLWFYILREAEVMANESGESGPQLGPVGGRIVAETFLGLLRADPASYYSRDPTWEPSLPTRSGDPRSFDIVDLLKFAAPETTIRF